jgi:2-polyprenyl-3-methyl-5-hydroxy-6-metoxy-1,4-benzoquinol methylase
MPSSNHEADPSNGWEAIAQQFMGYRTSNIGAAIVSSWAKSFERGDAVLDIGCGFGGNYTDDLTNRELKIYGIDASRTLIDEYQKKFPGAPSKCEAAEESSFFGRTFDGVLSIGLIFLLSEKAQISVLHKMAAALKAGGRFLFSSPYQACEWADLSTGRKSRSLGREKYVSILEVHGMSLVNEYTDEGESHYFEFQKNG